MPTLKEQVETLVANLVLNEARVDTWVNGTDAEDYTPSGGGSVPSIRKLLAETFRWQGDYSPGGTEYTLGQTFKNDYIAYRVTTSFTSTTFGADAANYEILFDLSDVVTDAESARDAAEAALDAFTDQYLGAFAADPVLDLDGDPLTEGDVYLNTTVNRLKVYTGSVWLVWGTIYGARNIADYGAIGDGVTDNSAAINAQLAIGGNIFVPEGVFIARELDVVVEGTTLFGLGRKSVLKTLIPNTTNKQLIKVNKGGGRYFKDVTIHSLYLDGNHQSGELGEIINGDNTENLTIRNCWFINAGEDAVDLDGLNPGAVVSYNHISLSQKGGIHSYGVRNGDISYNTIIGCGIGGAGGSAHPNGIDLTTQAAAGLTDEETRPENTTVIGNKIIDHNGGAGIATTTTAYNLKIIGNSVTNFTKSDTFGSAFALNGEGHKIIGNSVDGSEDYGFRLDFGVGKHQFISNSAENCTGIGVSIDCDNVTGGSVKVANSTTTGISLSGNNIEIEGAYTDVCGLYGLHIAGLNVKVNGGIVSGSTNYGVYIFGQFAALSNLDVKDGSNIGVRIQNDNAKISNLHIFDNTSDPINIAASDNINIVGCKLDSETDVDMIDMANCNNISIADCFIKNTVATGANAGVKLSGDNVKISGCFIEHATGIAITIGDSYCINGNHLNLCTTGISISNGSSSTNGVVSANFGEGTKFKNRGTANVATGTTSIIVNHGLYNTPDDIRITLTNITDSSIYAVTSKTATQFTLEVDADPTTANQTFEWVASRNQ